MQLLLKPKNVLRAVLRRHKDPTPLHSSLIAEVQLPERPLKVKRRSLLTGKVNEMTLPITMGEIAQFLSKDNSVLDAFPQLTSAQREFISTGITAEEWYGYAAKRAAKRTKPKDKTQ